MSNTKGDLAGVMEALAGEGHRAKQLAESGKISEPQVTISLDHDGMWALDFYSYCLDLNDHSRHHVAGSLDYDLFVDGLWAMVAMAQRENMETERHNLGQPGVAG